MSESEFNDYAEKVKKLKSRPTDAEMLDLYGLFKQATVGDVNTERPGLLDLKGKAKWDSWSQCKGTEQGQARSNYVELAKRLIEQYGLE
ncbi:hypothetical protein BOX15_Mlig029997g1 [Macrostomum lignano]|uniref:ACB domain-containing protein n=1 Tax=Macrostomum lignano TaxID=282301 RepID=A0A267EX94_9PLAT|nr:hypothetical protein BOX15_Mlig029997g1 [Macrostomum lignano]